MKDMRPIRKIGAAAIAAFLRHRVHMTWPSRVRLPAVFMVFSKAPIQAEISITSADGEKKVATTIVNERNGWLYLSAKGFKKK
jgi:hypothetical protein